MPASRQTATIRPIGSARLLPLVQPDELRTVTAQISLSDAALVRLLSVSSTQTRFVLTSVDGDMAVQAIVVLSTVPDAEQAFAGGRLRLNWSRGTLAHGQRQTTLSRMELRLVAILLDLAPDAVPRERIIAQLWPDGGTAGADREKSLKVWICQLRRHLAAIGQPDAIETVRGLGYALRY